MYQLLLPPPQLLRLRLEVSEHFFLTDHLLDPLQQPPVDHECGYNMFQRVKQMILPPEGTGSAESSLSEPSLLAEGILENLGCEWRVIHPFDIPGVRFPTDNTSPNQRRLAENDTLMELIQTTEYLEDTPMWGQRDY